ncbi:hypothetical protein HK405_015177, partial [Cladochytrium tenue]
AYAGDAVALEEAARALSQKSHGCFLCMALAFEPLLHPGIGGGVVIVGDPAGGATVGGSLAAAVAATVAPVPPRQQVTFRCAVEVLHAVETFPEGLDAVCLGLATVLPLPPTKPPAATPDDTTIATTARRRRGYEILPCFGNDFAWPSRVAREPDYAALVRQPATLASIKA